MTKNQMMFVGCHLLNIFFCLISVALGFNVDIPSRIIHSSPQPDSWFGFSVAMLKHDNINTLLVGAPKYNTSQPGVVRGGAVLRCPVDSDLRRCEYVPFDNNGPTKNQLGYSMDGKSNQFFGATVKSKNGIVVACAPRYVWYTSSRKRREPVGTCYVARHGLTDFQEMSPCRTDQWGYHRQGSCQAGFDAALTNNGNRLYIGAPGAYYWQGQIHSQSLLVRSEYFTTGEGPADEDDQYLGYSVAAGDFNNDGIQDMALGVPKGLNYTGKVALYSHDLRWLQNITGDQLGSYFGYCLAVLDFNGDSLDDIVVGAPMFTDFEDREMKIEIGKVHVLLQDNVHRFSSQIEYFGTVDRGRFGLSVASLGDINLDKYQDFAVGSPYGGLDGRGAVFIYHGFATSAGQEFNDVMKKPVQVIYASDIGSRFSTFGWSLSGGIDVDDNQYPDLLVGAYASGRAFLFKSRPIIKFLEHKLEFKAKGKTIDIDSKNCKIKRGQSFTCLDLEFCLAFTGINVQDKIELAIEYRLDTKQNSEQRVLFESNDQGVLKENIQFVKGARRCRSLKSYLKRTFIDKLTPIAANVSYILIERRPSPGQLTPVLDRDQLLSMQDSLTIQKNCGPDNICIPNLVLTFDAPDEFIMGQTEMLNVSIKVENKGEDAFESMVFISQPTGLLFNKFEPRENTSCSVRKIDGQNFVKCDIGNPFPMHHTANFRVFFQQSGLLEKPEFDFLVTANCTNAEAQTYGDNVARKIIAARVDAQLTLFGSSDPESIIYNTSIYQVPLRDSEIHYGPSLVHKYGLLSKGPSAVQDAEIMILWPSQTLSGDHLLYMMEQPITVGNIKCDPVPNVNPLNLKTISKEERNRILRLTSFDGSGQTSSAQSSTSGGTGSTTVISGGSSSTGSTSTSWSSSSSSSSISSGNSVGSIHQGGSSGSIHQGGSSGSIHQGGSSGSIHQGGSSGSIHQGGTSGSIYQGGSSGSTHQGGSIYQGGSGHYGSSGSSIYQSGSSGYQQGGHSSSSSGSTGGSYSSPGATSGDGQWSYSRNTSSSGYYSPDNTNSYGSQGGGVYNSNSGGGMTSGGHTSSSSSGTGGVYQGTYSKENQYVSSGSSGQGSQSNLLLPSSGKDGKFAATMFTVSGGGSDVGSGLDTGSSSGHSYNRQSSYHSGSSSDNTYDGEYGKGSNGSFGSDQMGQGSYYSSGSDGSGRYYSSSSHYESKPYTHSVSSSSYKHSSSSSEDLYRQNEIDSRTKRDTSTNEQWENLVSECGATLCTRIHCRTGSLTSNDDVFIYIRSRLWVDTLNEFKFPVDDVTITTRMVARANVKPRGVTTDNIEVLSQNVVTPIRSAKSLGESSVPWWVILLATLAGILILLLIILILWKCGYFKRHRPRHKARVTEDSRPLNPAPRNGVTNGVNGHNRGRFLYPGDEAL